MDTYLFGYNISYNSTNNFIEMDARLTTLAIEEWQQETSGLRGKYDTYWS